MSRECGGRHETVSIVANPDISVAIARLLGGGEAEVTVEVATAGAGTVVVDLRTRHVAVGLLIELTWRLEVIANQVQVQQ